MNPVVIRHSPHRKGFALFVALAFVVIVATLALVITVNLTGHDDQKRILDAAYILHRFTAASDSLAPSFSSQVGRKPGRLSELVTKVIGGTDLSDCGVPFTASEAANWKGPYHLIPMQSSGYNVVPGFFANDVLIRNPTIGSAGQAGTLAIVMNGVALADAQALGLLVDKVSTGAGPVVRFTPSGTSPITVSYTFAIVGC